MDCIKNRICTCFFYLLFLYAPYIFIGCSNASSSSYDLYSTVTLRTALSNLANSTDWASVQENAEDTGDLQQKIIRLPADSPQNAENLFIALLEIEEPVYPFLEHFTILDTNAMPETARSLIDGVLLGCKNKNLEPDFFSADTAFLKMITEYELKLRPDIDTWILGYVQMVQDGVYEIPVRFFTDRDFFDAYIYITNKDSQSYKVEQLCFAENAE
ncbi:hypothetical protein H0R92_10065 [Treponema sp. OMZ 840]|uniref:hypothetical protein n=1 Tax=Treponema sp. OMZ 840 TaxID=244313 RepID=UPI003D929443